MRQFIYQFINSYLGSAPQIAYCIPGPHELRSKHACSSATGPDNNLHLALLLAAVHGRRFAVYDLDVQHYCVQRIRVSLQ